MSNITEISYALPVGTSLKNGKYKILKVIGAGGMGITYLAAKKADTTFEDDEQLVIKELFITPNNTNSHCTRNYKNNCTVLPEGDLKKSFSDFKKRFYSEAKTLHKFSKLEAMVKVKDLFEENDTVYFTMEYIDGKNLQEFVANKGKLSLTETTKLLERIGKLLVSLHKENFLHRDVKPENILIDKQGKSYLIDFGIAKGYDDLGIVKTLTTMGTKRYAPPEQLSGEKSMITEAIDVFALANTFYYCLTGIPPQTADEASYQGEKTIQDFTPNISNNVNKIIENGRKRQPKQRTKNIEEFINKILGETSTIKNKSFKKEKTTTEKTEVFKNNIVDEKTIIETTKKPTNFTQKVKNANLDMIAIEGGSFSMGDNSDDDNEKHKVNLDSYYIAKYPVTQEVWKAVMGDNPSYFQKGVELKSGGIFSSTIILDKDTSKHPVETVSWQDIQKFIKILNNITGKTYRLPTEAEWEFAAKGGVKSNGYTYAGSNDIDKVAWYWINSGEKRLNGDWDYDKLYKNICRTHRVGNKQANELGLYDMSGNVREWCSDWYAEDYYKNSPTKNPKGPNSGDDRVNRGGSWINNAQGCRSAYRNFNINYRSPSNGNYNLGFRLAWSPQ